MKNLDIEKNVSVIVDKKIDKGVPPKIAFGKGYAILLKNVLRPSQIPTPSYIPYRARRNPYHPTNHGHNF